VVPFKEYMSHAFVAMWRQDPLRYNMLQILTPAGMIFGTPVLARDGEYDASRHLLPETVAKMVAMYHDELGDADADNAEYHFIELEDVTIINGGARLNCPYFLIYIDQITGISFINRDALNF